MIKMDKEITVESRSNGHAFNGFPPEADTFPLSFSPIFYIYIVLHKVPPMTEKKLSPLKLVAGLNRSKETNLRKFPYISTSHTYRLVYC